MYKKVNLVMLPTNKKAIICKYKYGEILRLNNHTDCIYQNLYILSDEEIEEDDWYVNININKVLQCDSQNFGVINLFKHCKKIIATTDTSLTFCKDSLGTKFQSSIKSQNKFILPQPSQSFIEKYVEEYNKGNIITEVMVEYEANLSDSPYTSNKQNNALKALKESSGIGCKLKIDSNNIINIKPIKNSWSKKEQFENIIKFRDDYEKFKNDCHFGPNNKEIEEWTDKWIEENL